MTPDRLLQSVPTDAPYRPLLRRLIETRQRIFQPMLDSLEETQLDAYLDHFARIHRLVHAMSDRDGQACDDALIAGLDYHSIEFLRRQARFLQTGRYAAESDSAVFEQVYQNPAVMDEYLNGLLLTYVAWPNQFRLLRAYQQHYLSIGPEGPCLEVGPGHGYLALLQLLARPGSQLRAWDISPHSASFSRALIAAEGVEPGRWQIEAGAFTGQRPLGPFSRAVLAEVIEHVTEPREILQPVRASLAEDGVAFVTTVINIEAPDHLCRFETPEQIDDLLAETNLPVQRRWAWPLAIPSGEMLCANYAAVCSAG